MVGRRFCDWVGVSVSPLEVLLGKTGDGQFRLYLPLLGVLGSRLRVPGSFLCTRFLPHFQMPLNCTCLSQYSFSLVKTSSGESGTPTQA